MLNSTASNPGLYSTTSGVVSIQVYPALSISGTGTTSTLDDETSNPFNSGSAHAAIGDSDSSDMLTITITQEQTGDRHRHDASQWFPHQQRQLIPASSTTGTEPIRWRSRVGRHDRVARFWCSRRIPVRRARRSTRRFKFPWPMFGTDEERFEYAVEGHRRPRRRRSPVRTIYRRFPRTPAARMLIRVWQFPRCRSAACPRRASPLPRSTIPAGLGSIRPMAA